MPSLSSEDLIRVKLELAQTLSRTDTIRLQARQLISQRTALRESTAKVRAEMKEEGLVLEETREDIRRLEEEVKVAVEEGERLREKLAEKGR